ncbi:MAG: phosphatase PAP2 family protein [Desulfuromonadales bacterium]|nr:phosphatase PAP2 family protein [Desulfuromonadales bacterium]
MKQGIWAEFLAVLATMMSLTILIAYSGADLSVSSHFYQSNGWPVGEQFPWKWLYRMDGYPAIAIATFGLCSACSGGIMSRHRLWRRQGIFLVLLLVLGPGLLVNVVFKSHWGRPRPRDIVEFNGSQQFRHPWQPAINNSKGHSFPSGHCSAAFYMTAPFFIYRHRKPELAKRWLVGGAGFGLLMSYARIAQGGHFLSDTLWAWGIVHMLAIMLSTLLLSNRNTMVYAPQQGELQDA